MGGWCFSLVVFGQASWAERGDTFEFDAKSFHELCRKVAPRAASVRGLYLGRRTSARRRSCLGAISRMSRKWEGRCGLAPSCGRGRMSEDIIGQRGHWAWSALGQTRAGSGRFGLAGADSGRLAVGQARVGSADFGQASH